MTNYLTLADWDNGSIEQRSKWLAEGRIVSPEDAAILRAREWDAQSAQRRVGGTFGS